MKKLNNDVWEKCAILGDKNLSHDRDYILLDKNNLQIKLLAEICFLIKLLQIDSL